MAAETITIDVVINAKNQTSAGMESAKRTADKFTESVKKSKSEIDRLNGTNVKPQISMTDRATSTLTKVNNGLRAIGGKTVRAGVKIIDYATRPLRAIKNTLFSVKGLVAAIGTGMAANKLLMEPINLADQYSSAKIGFSTLLGDTKGQKMMDDLDKFAKETPFKTSNTIAQAQKMIAMGWDAKNIVKDMTTIGDAAAATGKGDEGLQRITLALSQIKSKGKLSTEELNQLAEAGISAKRYLAEGLGYGSGDSGLMALSKDLEKGAIGADAAIQAIMQGMKEYQGMMETTANETVEGLKSQLEDTFEINIARRWGQGLQDGAKRGLGSILELLNRSEKSLEKFGDTVYDIGKELSNWAADKLEGTIDKILELSNSKAFKEASFGEKIKIMWDEVIAEPFGDWWESKGKPYMAKKMGSLGEGLGSGLSKSIAALLGIDVVGTGSEAVSIGSSFASGFSKGFKSMKVGEALIKAIGRAFKSGFTAFFTGSALEKIIVGGLALKVTSGIMSGITKAQTLWSGTGELVGGGVGGLGSGGAMTLSGMGLKGIIGSTGNAMVGGSGILGKLASIGYKVTGKGITPGMYFGNMTGTMSGGTAALAGLGTTAGIAGGVAGTVNAIGDLTRTIKANSKNDKTMYGTRAGVKAGMVGTGAAIGTMIAPGLGTAIGAGLGGIATYLAGNKLADAISGVSKSTSELNAEADKLASKQMAKRFGEVTLSADQLSKKVTQVFGEKTIGRVNKFNESMSALTSAQSALSDYKDTVDYTHARIMAKENLAESDITAYKEALEGYSSATKQLLSANKASSTSAFQLLFGDDTKGLQVATKGMNKTYTKLEKDLASRSKKLNDVIGKAFEDGKITIDEEKKINEMVSKIQEIQRKIEERIQKSESKAGYDLIGMKYKNTDLTADSFKSLISELNKQGETDMEAYDKAYIKAKAELDLELEEGTIDKKSYDKALKKIEEKYFKGKEETIKRQVNISLEVLKTNYSGEFSGIEKVLNSGQYYSDSQFLKLKNSTMGTAKGPGGTLREMKWDKKSKIEFESLRDSFLEGAGVSKADQKELAALYDSLKPQEKDLKELKKSYQDAGKQVPQWIEDSLSDIENIKLMSGDMDTFYKLIGEQIAKTDKDYAEKLKGTSNIPKALKEGIEKGLKETGSETVDYKTNLKVTADKKNIDTSNLDKTTKDVVEKLKDNGTLKVTKDGKVTVKTKDGKIDTTGLDKDTKSALEKLEKEGIIKVNKKGEVTVKADVKTGNAKKKSNSKTKSELGKKTNVNKKASVNVKSDTKTGTAKKSADKKTKNALGKPVSTKKIGRVNVTSQTTGAEAAAEQSKQKFKGSADSKFSKQVNEKGKVHVSSCSLSGAGAAIASAWDKFKTWAKDKFSNTVSVSSTVRVDTVKSGGTGGGKKKKKKSANGGYIDRFTETIVGEAGPEFIIPVSASRRQRGKYLWERAGRALGIMENANGGLYGVGSSRLGNMLDSAYSVNGTETDHITGGKSSVNVDVGGVNITIQSSGEGVRQDVQQNADAIAGEIASILQKAFQNMPITVGT